MNKPNVYVTRQIPHEGIDLLCQTCNVQVNPDDRVLSRAELLDKIKGRDGILCLLTDRMDGEAMDAAKGIKGIANYAVGYDNIDIAEATKRRIPISNTPGVLTDATAELAWTLLFAVARRIPEADAFMRTGQWKGWGPLQFVGGDVTGKTLGIVGAGRIGTAMALKSKGFRMNVLYCDAFQNDILENELNAKKTELDSLLEQSDYVSVHVPLNEETKHLLGMEQFKKMKPTAYLINTARGPIVNETELVEALKANEIAGAGLDVYEREPQMVPGLADLENVVVLPHIASATKNSRTGMATMAATNLLAMLEGKKPPNCVNPEIFE